MDEDHRLSDHERKVIAENGWTQAEDGHVYDAEGRPITPMAVAAAVTEAKRDDPTTWPDSRQGKAAPQGIDGLFVRPGTAIDSDGLMGSPAEMLAPPPAVEAVVPPTGERDGASPHAGRTPPGSTAAIMAQARAAGERVLSAVAPKGTPAFKADHRQVATGQYVEGPAHPAGTPARPSHEVTQVNLADPAQASAFVRSPVAPTPAGVPTIRVVPPEETKGASR